MKMTTAISKEDTTPTSVSAAASPRFQQTRLSRRSSVVLFPAPRGPPKFQTKQLTSRGMLREVSVCLILIIIIIIFLFGGSSEN